MSVKLSIIFVVLLLLPSIFMCTVKEEDKEEKGEGASIETAIIVSSVDEEYVILEGTKCECGGYFYSEGQELLIEDGHYYDLLNGVCDKCGEKREFYFNVDKVFEGYNEMFGGSE